MPAHPAQMWRDPLFSPGNRFPLGPPRGIMDHCQEEPSGHSTLPPAEANTGDALTELARFFAVAADSDQACPMFSTCIDQAWHALLSTPDSYAQFSRDACGEILGHRVSWGEGQIPWVSNYETRFGKLPALWFADATGTVDQTAYATYCATGEVFHSWDCNPTTNEGD